MKNDHWYIYMLLRNKAKANKRSTVAGGNIKKKKKKQVVANSFLQGFLSRHQDKSETHNKHWWSDIRVLWAHLDSWRHLKKAHFLGKHSFFSVHNCAAEFYAEMFDLLIC